MIEDRFDDAAIQCGISYSIFYLVGQLYQFSNLCAVFVTRRGADEREDIRLKSLNVASSRWFCAARDLYAVSPDR